jgi:hypothetical protein
MQGRFGMLTALLLIAVLHNGAAMPSVAALGHILPADAGMSQHCHDAMDGDAFDGHPADGSHSKCCGSASCDCSCMTTPPGVLRLAPAPRVRVQTIVLLSEDAAVTPRRPSGAPFRPPA